MQTHHVPMSMCNSTLVLQFEDRVPPALGRIEPQRFSTTVKEVNRMIVDGTPRKLIIGFVITMLLMTTVFVVLTALGYNVVYIHLPLVFVLIVPYSIYVYRSQLKVLNSLVPTHRPSYVLTLLSSWPVKTCFTKQTML